MIIQVGQAIGALWTVLLLIADSIIGARLLRWQGRRAGAASRRRSPRAGCPTARSSTASWSSSAARFLLTPGLHHGHLRPRAPDPADARGGARAGSLDRACCAAAAALGYGGGRARRRAGPPAAAARRPQSRRRPATPPARAGASARMIDRARRGTRAGRRRASSTTPSRVDFCDGEREVFGLVRVARLPNAGADAARERGRLRRRRRSGAEHGRVDAGGARSEAGSALRRAASARDARAARALARWRCRTERRDARARCAAPYRRRSHSEPSTAAG